MFSKRIDFLLNKYFIASICPNSTRVGNFAETVVLLCLNGPLWDPETILVLSASAPSSFER